MRVPVLLQSFKGRSGILSVLVADRETLSPALFGMSSQGFVAIEP
jgi:hypothetical protein